MDWVYALLAVVVLIGSFWIAALVLKEFFPMPDTDEESDESPPWF